MAANASQFPRPADQEGIDVLMYITVHHLISVVLIFIVYGLLFWLLIEH